MVLITYALIADATVNEVEQGNLSITERYEEKKSKTTNTDYFIIKCKTPNFVRNSNTF